MSSQQAIYIVRKRIWRNGVGMDLKRPLGVFYEAVDLRRYLVRLLRDNPNIHKVHRCDRKSGAMCQFYAAVDGHLMADYRVIKFTLWERA